MLASAEEVCGKTRGGERHTIAYRKDPLLWNKEVQTKLNTTKAAFKEWPDTGDENKNMTYSTATKANIDAKTRSIRRMERSGGNHRKRENRLHNRETKNNQQEGYGEVTLLMMETSFRKRRRSGNYSDPVPTHS